METFDGKLVIAISSRALFDLDESHMVWQNQGLEAYRQYQREHEDVLLKPGVAFSMVRKFLALNKLNPDKPRIEVLLLSRMHADTSLRVFNSIQHYGLDITRAAFTGGADTCSYLQPFNVHLYLSADPEAVRHALDNGYAAATILPSAVNCDPDSAGADADQLRIAFDGDAVLFSDEAERIYKTQGLEAFSRSEQAAAKKPLTGGPFKNFLRVLHEIQEEYPHDDSPIRTALITARSTPAHERVIRTLDSWNVRIDEALFLGGLAKGEFLRTFRADIFFDDQRVHCDSAKQFVPTGHVPHGVANNPPVVKLPDGNVELLRPGGTIETM